MLRLDIFLETIHLYAMVSIDSAYKGTTYTASTYSERYLVFKN